MEDINNLVPENKQDRVVLRGTNRSPKNSLFFFQIFDLSKDLHFGGEVLFLYEHYDGHEGKTDGGNTDTVRPEEQMILEHERQEERTRPPVFFIIFKLKE